MIAHRIALLASVYVGAGALATGAAWAQSDSATRPQPIGKVLTVTGTASIEHPAAIVVQANLPANPLGAMKVGDFVYQGDVIQTGVDSGLSIAFVDGTSFNVTSNAKMEVNEFVYDPKGHANSTLLSLTKGTFTFIAGDIAHTGNMKVDTPLGTMGIRGTAPRVEISEDGTVKFSTLIEEK